MDESRHYFGRPLGLCLIVLYEVGWGLVEAVSGGLLMSFHSLLMQELIEDPHDLMANWLAAHVTMSPSNTTALAWAIIVLGISKLLLGFGIWHRIRAIRPIGLAIFGLLAAYGLYHLTISFSTMTVLALLADFGILLYFWLGLPRHLSSNNLFE